MAQTSASAARAVSSENLKRLDTSVTKVFGGGES